MNKQLFFAFFFALMAISVNLSAKTIYVRGGYNADFKDGQCWSNAYGDVQTALSEAVPDDEIWVGEGTFFSGNNRDDSFVVPRRVNLYGGFTEIQIADSLSRTSLSDYARQNTLSILSGEIGTLALEDNAFHVVVLKGTNVINGFTIIGGYNDDSEFDITQKGKGAGIYANIVANVTISNNIIKENIVTISVLSFISGGGVYISGTGTATIADNIIEGNTLEGMANSCMIQGAGVYSSKSANVILTNNVIQNNLINGLSTFSFAAGCGVYVGGDASILRNIIQNNTSNASVASGGGVFVEGNATLISNLIQSNTLNGLNNSVYGGGVCVDGEATLVNNTLVKNKLMGDVIRRGNAVFSWNNDVKIYNSIIWGNTGGESPIESDGGSFTVSNCLIQGGYSGGTSILSSDPSFTDYNGGDFTLQSTSFAINAGRNALYTGNLALDKDLKGNPRTSGIIDMGAYEDQGILAPSALLGSLTVTPGTLTPDFTPEVWGYMVNVANNISSVTIAGTGFTGNESIAGLGVKELIVGLNIFIVIASNGGGDSFYQITINRANPTPVIPVPPVKSSDATLKLITLSAGTLAPQFSPEVYNYAVEGVTDIATLLVDGAANNYLATVAGNGVYELKPGKNTITLTITAEDGTVKTYTLLATLPKTEVSIQEVAADNVKVYPTLTTGKVYIESTGNLSVVELYTLTGKLLQRIEATEIDLSDYPKGIYILHVAGKTVKVVKE